MDNRLKALSEKQKAEPKAGKAVMIVFYTILLIASVLLFFWSDVTITAVHIIVGALMVADGISSIAASVSAVKNGYPLKDKTFSIIAYSFSVLIGIAFIVFSWSTADLTMVICGIVMIVKGLSDLFIMLRNKEILTSAKGTINEIKQQGKKGGSEPE